MADGSIVFNTKIDSTEIPKEMKKVEQEIQKETEKIEKATDAKLPLVEQAKELGAKLDEAKANAHALREEMEAVNAAMAPGSDPDDYVAASADRDRVAAALEASEKEVKDLQVQYDKVNDKIDAYDEKIRTATESLEQNKKKAEQLSAEINTTGKSAGKLSEGVSDVGGKTPAAFTKAGESVKKFGKRLLEIGKSVLIFSVLSSALRKIIQFINKMLMTNKEYTAQLAKLKGALLTAFQPLYEVALPAALAILRVLTAVVSVIAYVLSALTGRTAAQSAKSAEALNGEAEAIENVGSAAEKAKKSLAGFDEVNTLGTEETGAGGGGSGSGIQPDFSAFDTAAYKAKIDELTVYLSGALLAVGAILAFSGINIPLGIALMAAGAIGMVAVVKGNPEGMSNELKAAIGKTALILGSASLVIGAILAFSGAATPLGISLMAIGAASLGTAGALNWNNIQMAMEGPVGDITEMASHAVLPLGLLLTLSGINPPLGISLIASGSTGLAAVGQLDWNAIPNKLSQIWEMIKRWFNTQVKPKLTLEFWKEKFSNIAEGLETKIKDGVNAAIALVNRFINWLNEKMVLKWSDFSIGGVKIIEAGTFRLLNIPNIPMLAQGAVLPPNKPFLAMVGDQKNGTNVEAPLETIKQALAEVMAMYGAGDVNVNFSGDLAPFIRWLKVEIDRENKRVGPSLAGGNV